MEGARRQEGRSTLHCVLEMGFSGCNYLHAAGGRNSVNLAVW